MVGLVDGGCDVMSEAALQQRGVDEALAVHGDSGTGGVGGPMRGHDAGERGVRVEVEGAAQVRVVLVVGCDLDRELPRAVGRRTAQDLIGAQPLGRENRTYQS